MNLKRLLTNDYLFLFVITMLVNAGNYGLNLFLGRFLGPVHFAEANVLTTLVLMISFFGVAFQLTAAKYIAKSESDQERLADEVIQITRRAGLIVGMVFVILSPILSEFLRFESVIPLFILFGALPFYMVLCTMRGVLQGRFSFKRLGLTYATEMVARVAFTTILVFQFSKDAPHLLSHAIAIGFAASFIIGQFSSGLKSRLSLFDKIRLPRGLAGFFIIMLSYEFCQILINNSDVILVKHFFENDIAGMYSALALIGRIVFFATWIMVTLLFPKIIQQKESGKDTNRLFLLSLGGVALVALGIVGFSFWQGSFIIELLFGSAYSAISDLLWLYALATAMFACANVFVYYYMSLGVYLPVVFSFIAGMAQILGICWLHQSLSQVLGVQLVITTSLLLSLTFFYLVKTRTSLLIKFIQPLLQTINPSLNLLKKYPHETV